MSDPHRVDIMGCGFDAITEDETLEQIFAWSDAPERNSHTIITVNVAILMMMRDDPELGRAVEQADLVVVDGTPLVWTAKWLEAPVPEKVSGVDLMARLLERGQSRGLRVFLLGTTEERLRGLEKKIREDYPGIVIAGVRNGYFSREQDAEVIALIKDAKADVLFVGMPAPFKELWCEKHRGELETPTILGVGGAFDVLGGYVTRAPKPLQSAGLEWAWRLAMEPKKLFRRYLVTNSRFLGLLGVTLARRGVLRRR